MNQVYKLVWSKVHNAYVVASEMAKSHSQGSQKQAVLKGNNKMGLCLVACTLGFSVMAMPQVMAQTSAEKPVKTELTTQINEEVKSSELVRTTSVARAKKLPWGAIEMGLTGPYSEVTGDFATYLGGYRNKAHGKHSTVIGGGTAWARGWESVAIGGFSISAASHSVAMGGKLNNDLSSDAYSVFLGGSNNQFSGKSGRAVIIGGDKTQVLSGRYNTIITSQGINPLSSDKFGKIDGKNNLMIGSDIVPLDGESNISINMDHTTVTGEDVTAIGGKTGYAGGTRSLVVGGHMNRVDDYQSTVIGGLQNASTGNRSTIVGGIGNNNSKGGMTVAGRGNNSVSRSYIIGGYHTGVGSNSDYGTVVAGSKNAIANDSLSATMVAGSDNSSKGNFALMVAGAGNQIKGSTEKNPTGMYGGTKNIATRNTHVLGGKNINAGASGTYTLAGSSNRTGKSSATGFLVGGNVNTISEGSTAILGGTNNNAKGKNSAIFGGKNNTTDGTDYHEYKVIFGGSFNKVKGIGTAVLGGRFSSAEGKYAAAIGGFTTTDAYSSTALAGASTMSGASYSVAIGKDAKTRSEGTVALGSKSVASGRHGGFYNMVTGKLESGSKNPTPATDCVIAIGTDDGKVTRQITGVAAGTKDTDAVNVAQLVAAGEALNSYAYKDASNLDVTNVTDWGIVLGIGEVKAGDVNLITGDTLYNEVRVPAGGNYNYISSDNTFGDNLIALDNQVHINETTTKDNTKEINNIKGDITDIQDDITNIKPVIVDIKDDITNIKDDVTDIKADVTTAQDDVSNIKGDINDIKDGVSNIQEDITNIEGDITDIKEDITNIEDSIIKVENDANIKLDGKADVDLGNITDAGKDVITDLIDVVAADGSAIIVTESVDETTREKTFEVDVDFSEIKNQITGGVDISYKAEGDDTALIVNSNDGFVFAGDDNLLVSVDANGEVKYELNEDITGINTIEVGTGDNVINIDGSTGDISVGDTVIGVDGISVGDTVIADNSVSIGKTTIDEGHIDGLETDKIVNGDDATNKEYVDNKVNEVAGDITDEMAGIGAHSAALSSLKVLQFNPHAKTQIMAGVGRYKNANSYALGLAVHSNADLLLNGAISFGSNRTMMMNAGVAWRVNTIEEGREKVDLTTDAISTIKELSFKLQMLEAQNMEALKVNAKNKHERLKQRMKARELKAENAAQTLELAVIKSEVAKMIEDKAKNSK